MSQTPEIDFSPITDINPSVADHPGWQRFQRAMNRRTQAAPYTRDGMIAAWTWFREGWDALDARLGAEATNWWCDHG